MKCEFEESTIFITYWLFESTPMIVISSLFMNYISFESYCLFVSVSTNNKKETNLFFKSSKMNKEGLMEFMIMKPLWMSLYSIELRFSFCCSTPTSRTTGSSLVRKEKDKEKLQTMENIILNTKKNKMYVIYNIFWFDG